MKKTLLIAPFSILVELLALGSVYAQSSNQGYNTPPHMVDSNQISKSK
jgi:hypothetical protein